MVGQRSDASAVNRAGVSESKSTISRSQEPAKRVAFSRDTKTNVSQGNEPSHKLSPIVEVAEVTMPEVNLEVKAQQAPVRATKVSDLTSRTVRDDRTTTALATALGVKEPARISNQQQQRPTANSTQLW